ncbi:saccharopine dehydrogenase family protein [Arenibaculum pallidiluteum]|uniref:saccharopine dehydrogenase family protein n=1 Tax=Arenibaculum pallidiluteum TaxID=2812559 RepID=UPI001A95F954|nr:saccharopine dehydrogenase C-terminal domain-containing protein [Arenibaculum pallidiluteum]
MAVTKVLLLGGGKIGAMITEMLAGCGDYAVTVADRDPRALERVARAGIAARAIDVADPSVLAGLVPGHWAVLSACPYTLTPVIAEAARAGGAHYFDLTEDVGSTRHVKELAKDADTAFVPQCGLAPGFISIVAHDLAQRFETVHNVHMRVGALPLYPSNKLKYNLTWSTDGLINEYCNPCEAIVDGELREVMPLEGDEDFALDGIAYEGFNTSGGLGTLCETLQGRVRNLDYKTVRYPGHREIIRLLIRDLRLGERRHILKDVLETAVPMTLQDVVLVFVTVSGIRDGQLSQESFAKKVYAKEIAGRTWSAIQVTTAAGICAMVDLTRAASLPQHGFVRQEQARLDDFLANRFGRHYA